MPKKIGETKHPEFLQNFTLEFSLQKFTLLPVDTDVDPQNPGTVPMLKTGVRGVGFLYTLYLAARTFLKPVKLLPTFFATSGLVLPSKSLTTKALAINLALSWLQQKQPLCPQASDAAFPTPKALAKSAYLV